MDIHTFNQLSLNERLKYTWDNATFLKSVSGKEKSCSMYYTTKLYIVVIYSSIAIAITEVNAWVRDFPLKEFLQKVFV